MSNIPEIDIEFEKNWLVKNRTYNKDTEYILETLLSIGNGYVVSRANMDETSSGNINYAGNYLIGLYNKALHSIQDKKIERDEIVNLPNWWYINFKIGTSSWFDINRTDFLEFERCLDLKNGVLHKHMVVKDKIGQITRIESKRIVNFKNPNIIAQQYTIEPVNYSATVKFNHKINGNIYNEKYLKTKHLYITEKEGVNNISHMIAETLRSNKSVIIMNKQDLFIDNKQYDTFIDYYHKEREILGEFEVGLKQNQSFKIEKIVYIKSYDLLLDPTSQIKEAKETIQKYHHFDQVLDECSEGWGEVWKKSGIEIEDEENSQTLINFYLYHLFITFSKNTPENVSGLPTYSVQGENNNGLTGWEEMFILPLLNMQHPDLSKKILDYRFNRLNNALKNASLYNKKGALFPWKSGINGDEQSFKEKYDPVNKKWVENPSYLQSHINISVAYNIIHYYKTTNDKEFILNIGLKTLVEICRFWQDSVSFDRNKNRYNLNNVLGPDEFHTKYANANKSGLNNNAYTNFMLTWLFKQVLNLINELNNENCAEILEGLNISTNDLEKWKDISMFMKIEISDDEIIEQFSGFFELKEIDWLAYRNKFPDLHNLEKFLSAEGKKVNDYQVVKQADALLPFYFLNPNEIRNIMLDTGYLLEKNFLDYNFDYYYKRTSHASLLSKPVHALISFHNNYIELCYELFKNTLPEVQEFQYEEIPVNGINMGVTGALLNVIFVAFAGLQFDKNHIYISPCLPKQWKKLTFKFNYYGATFRVSILGESVEFICIANTNKQEFILNLKNKEYLIETDKEIKV